MFIFVVTTTLVPPPQNPCFPSPCGPNTECRVVDGRAGCSCIPDFFGVPELGCRPECVLNTDCNRQQSCVRNKCANPCDGQCGRQAECTVVNHMAVCTCPERYTGDPFIRCVPGKLNNTPYFKIQSA